MNKKLEKKRFLLNYSAVKNYKLIIHKIMHKIHKHLNVRESTWSNFLLILVVGARCFNTGQGFIKTLIRREACGPQGAMTEVGLLLGSCPSHKVSSHGMFAGHISSVGWLGLAGRKRQGCHENLQGLWSVSTDFFYVVMLPVSRKNIEHDKGSSNIQILIKLRHTPNPFILRK